MYRRPFLIWCLALPLSAAVRRKRIPTHFFATAHSEEGTTAAGSRSRPGTAAADPNVLPLGSRIRVTGAGPYSGVYTIEDTGRAIKGNEIDIYMRSGAEAKKFGRRRVRVRVLAMPAAAATAQ